MCLLRDNSGLIWVGTYKGISTFKPNTNFLHFKSTPNDRNSLMGNVIQGIYRDYYNDTLLLGSSGEGVNIFDGTKNTRLSKENSDLISNEIRDITGYKDKVFTFLG
jgi:ligand-binding sensor domain-containing protein